MLLKISILNKCCSFEIYINKNLILKKNDHSLPKNIEPLF